ncbi:MAG: hypothetical protein MUE40_20470 [Anaerolineae bacterium]|jgi:hypothetical protein|nr:hypothetical protein [Anaerolineae bacterium]
MRVYLKLFFAAALPYGLLMGLLFTSVAAGIGFGVGAGLVLATIFGTLQHSAVDGKKAGSEAGVHHQRTIEIDLPLRAALALGREALAGVPGARLHSLHHDEAHGQARLEARTRLNWQTLGERITLRLDALDAVTTRITLESRPRYKTTLIDYGKNLHHVNLLSRYLRQHSAIDPLPPARLLDEAQLPSLASLVGPAAHELTS